MIHESAVFLGLPLADESIGTRRRRTFPTAVLLPVQPSECTMQLEFSAAPLDADPSYTGSKTNLATPRHV